MKEITIKSILNVDGVMMLNTVKKSKQRSDSNESRYLGINLMLSSLFSLDIDLGGASYLDSTTHVILGFVPIPPNYYL